jgi:hypothetical protein
VCVDEESVRFITVIFLRAQKNQNGCLRWRGFPLYSSDTRVLAPMQVRKADLISRQEMQGGALAHRVCVGLLEGHTRIATKKTHPKIFCKDTGISGALRQKSGYTTTD